MCGAAIAGWLVDYKGRQFTLVMCSLPYTIGWLLILLCGLITSYFFRPLLLTGRFINGMGIGAASLVVPVSIQLRLFYNYVIVTVHVQALLDYVIGEF